MYDFKRKPMFKMVIGSHFFKVLGPDIQTKSMLGELKRKFELKGLVRERGRWMMKPLKVFGSETDDRFEYRFHINQLKDWLDILSRYQVPRASFEMEMKPMFDPAKIKAKATRNPRDDQRPIVDYLVNPYDDKSNDPQIKNRNKLVPAPPGFGKTVISMVAAVEIGHRTLIMVKPSFMDKWFGDVLSNTDSKNTDIMMCSGSAQLKGLIELAQTGKLKSKFIILSSKTFQNYIKTFQMFRGDKYLDGYECDPEDFFETLKVGLVISDEVHMEFHLNFINQIHCHVPMWVNLSGTLVNTNPFLEKMYEVYCPKDTRYNGIKDKKYVKSYALSYKFEKPEFIRTSERGSTMYSHHAFEESVMRHKGVFGKYKELIKFMAEQSYFRDYQKGDKLAIFATSIHMCTELTKYFKELYPHLDVRRYVEDDPYENVIDADIRISTILSSGTAIDIPNLRAVILTVNVNSIQSNRQTIGRLRELKDRDVKFWWCYCSQFDKHRDYSGERKDQIKNRVLFVKDYEYYRNI